MMKGVLLALLLQIPEASTTCLMITGIVDAIRPSSAAGNYKKRQYPKAVELYATCDVPNVGQYGLVNNLGKNFSLSFGWDGGTVLAGTFLYYESQGCFDGSCTGNAFESFFETSTLDPPLTEPLYEANYDKFREFLTGNTSIALTLQGTEVDLFGDPAASTPGLWAYAQGWCYRTLHGSQASVVFDLDKEWSCLPQAFSGGANVGAYVTNSAAPADRMFPMRSFSNTPAPTVAPPTPATAPVTPTGGSDDDSNDDATLLLYVVIFVIALLVCFCLFFLWQRRGGSGGEGSGRNKKGDGSRIEFSEFADDYVDPVQLKAQEELEKGGGGRGRLASVDGEVNPTTGVYHVPRHALTLEAKPFARGGGGQIFRGKYRATQIAAKQVFSAMENEADMEEFDREVAMLVKLTHPNVLCIFGTSSDPDGAMYQVLEFCSGGDLQGYYATDDFTMNEFNRVCLELLSGVVYLHERQIAHRDLKPENVLLSDPKTRKVKIADFGLAKANRNTVTRGVGTPSYMPPEMFDDETEGLNVSMLAVDIYALGIILGQLWTKRSPWKGKSPHKVMAFALKGKRPPLDGFKDANPPPPPPPELKALIEAMWSQLVEDRPKIESAFQDFEEQVIPSVEAMVGTSVDTQRSKTRATVSDVNSNGSMLTQAELDAALQQRKDEEAYQRSVEGMLEGVRLQGFYDRFSELGFTSASFKESDTLTDDVLVEAVGMTREEARKLRKHLSESNTVDKAVKAAAHAATPKASYMVPVAAGKFVSKAAAARRRSGAAPPPPPPPGDGSSREARGRGGSGGAGGGVDADAALYAGILPPGASKMEIKRHQVKMQAKLKAEQQAKAAALMRHQAMHEEAVKKSGGTTI